MPAPALTWLRSVLAVEIARDEGEERDEDGEERRARRDELVPVVRAARVRDDERLHATIPQREL